MAGAALTPEQYNDFIKLLEDFVKTEDERRALIQRAFAGAPVVHKLDYSGSGVTFCANMLERLYAYDREAAIIRLLETVRDQELGPSRRHEADALIRNLLSQDDSAQSAAELAAPLSAGPSGARVFISYSRDDADLVSRLRADLDARGVPYWIDKVGLVPGTADWEEGLRTAIAESRAVILVATPVSRRSPYVRDEIAIAQMHGKRVFPLWAVDQPWMECVPVGMGYVQYIDMRNDADYQAGIAALVAALVASVETQPPPPVLAGTPKNPYKGLMAFDEADADRFFGREALIESLLQQMGAQLGKQGSRFLAVLGPSGAGKSSVVRAGLIPALKAGRLPGSQAWTYLPLMFPGAHPIEYLAEKLKSQMPDTSLSSIETDLNAPGGRMLHRLARLLPGERVLLYIDQFEELFTLTGSEREREHFISLISQGVSEPDGKLVVLVSMRADFLGYPLNYPLLGDLFGAYSALVKPLTIAELYDAIESPAHLPGVGLTFDPGLVADIVYALRSRDEGALAGALPLLQFTLERLYEQREGSRLTWAAYHAMGRVAGAIGTYSEAVFGGLPEAAQSKLGQVFIQLVSIDETNKDATRRRALKAEVTADTEAQQLVDTFVESRLFQTGRDGEQIYLEVAHEALLRSWERLVSWIDKTRADLLTIRRMEREAYFWNERGNLNHLLPNAEEIAEFNAACTRLGRALNDPVLVSFIEPEQTRLIREIEIVMTDHERRRDIGDRLAVIGELRPGVGVRDGIPDMTWLPVAPGGEIEIRGKYFNVYPFYIAQHLVTHEQFQAFFEAADGFYNPVWWDKFPEKFRPQELSRQRTKIKNAPRDTVSWYHAAAFAQWMNHRCNNLLLPIPGDVTGRSYVVGSNAEIRLPTEWEWQWMAQGGRDVKPYPWGEWRTGYANTSEAGLSRSTAVGMYLHGATKWGALDVAGNLFEWCLNDFHNPERVDDYSNERFKAVRGGSFGFDQNIAAASFYFFVNPYFPLNVFGLRLMLGIPMRSLV